MVINGVSQSSGVERVVEITRAESEIAFVFRDRIGNVERESILFPMDDILATLADRPKGGSTINGTSPNREERKLLDIEVKRNEVLLTARGESKPGSDAAVGLDDLMDALEGVMPSD